MITDIESDKIIESCLKNPDFYSFIKRIIKLTKSNIINHEDIRSVFQFYTTIKVLFSKSKYFKLIPKLDLNYLYNELFKVLKIIINQFNLKEDKILIFISKNIMYYLIYF